jgi:hypothetical protein
MATDDDVAAMNLYVGLMTELRDRLRSSNILYNNHAYIPALFIFEYFALQLRMSCVLLALACLVAHGDIKETKSKELQKAWKPDFIISALDELREDFFPVPFVPVVSPGHLHLEDFPSNIPVLHKDDVKVLYGYCGDILHKGSLRDLLQQRSPQRLFDDVLQWTQKFLNLLNNHRTLRFGRDFTFVTMLNDLSRGGNVTVAIGEVPKPPESSPSTPGDSHS